MISTRTMLARTRRSWPAHGELLAFTGIPAGTTFRDALNGYALATNGEALVPPVGRFAAVITTRDTVLVDGRGELGR